MVMRQLKYNLSGRPSFQSSMRSFAPAVSHDAASITQVTVCAKLLWFYPVQAEQEYVT